MRKQWMIKQSGINIKELAIKSGINETIARLLANRGLKEAEAVKKFIGASLGDLYDGKLMKDMALGVNIIKEAIENGKSILIYGDYDVDGVVSTYILYRALLNCGAQVNYYIPDRESEGYGMNSERIEKLKEEGYQVILTCDNGIAAFDQIRLAVELGLQVVVTDHHDVPYQDDENGVRKFILPEAQAVINPKQQECTYPFKLLCGGSIAFKFAEVLYEAMEIDKNYALEFIEYAAISTICDVVDLIGENRIIAKNGLRMLNKTKNIGLKALIMQTSLKDKKIGTYHIGFIMGPCINATGRLDNAKLSVELLLCEKEETALVLAKRLFDLNVERQELTSKGLDQLIESIEKGNLQKDKVLVIYNKSLHESIAGIVAGRIKEKYNKPTIVLTKGRDTPKGSGRSIEAYNMFEELLKCKDLLSKFGGHPMAAGLTVEEENILLLRERLNNNCRLSDEDLVPKIRIDSILSLSQVDYNIILELEKLEPFGKGNPSPLFAEKEVQVFKVLFLGKEKKVVKFLCKIKNSNNKIDAISFDNSEEFKNMINESYGDGLLLKIMEGSDISIFIDIIYYPSINEYKGTKSMQLILKEFRLSKK